MFGTGVAEPILAGGHVHRHQQTGHMIASDPIRSCQALASRGPSTYGSRLFGRDDTADAVTPQAQRPTLSEARTRGKMHWVSPLSAGVLFAYVIGYATGRSA